MTTRALGAASALVAGLALSGVAQAALVKSYDFNGTLNDTLGNGASLVSLGGTVGMGDYTFRSQEGLRLTSALPNTSSYAIEMRLRVTDSVTGWNKLIDFQQRSSDNGLYIHDGEFTFFSGLLIAGSVAVNTDFTVGLARSSDNKLSLYLNNGLLRTDADPSSWAVPSTNVLNFFVDDIKYPYNEAFAGVVDFIRIHDDASTFGSVPGVVPLPAAVWLLASALGLAGLGFNRRRAH